MIHHPSAANRECERMASFTERMIGAATLNVQTYEELEHDHTATGQAAGVVALVAVSGAIGNAGAGLIGIVGAILGAFVGWYIWSAVTLFVGKGLFNGTADMGEMLRTIGFAQSPGVFYVLGIVPFLGGWVRFGVWIWMLLCAVVAIRQALDFTTGRALGTALIGWLVYILIRGLLALLTFGLI
jgi:hypothetical protein